ncbi:MAG: RuBisCO large subunit C-terminal-like domain-containing protein, partial [Planctomycetota bacterium]|nr:RuBisCO large subunit C-terminal-like domain-containing protein [Planctomycetota bacterium]
IATALKPRGSSPQQLAAIAGAFALGGGDIIKDDHNLAEDSFDAFATRVRVCQEAVAEANAKTGRNTLYFPNISVPLEQLDRHVEMVLRTGIRGILVAPFILGLDAVRTLAQRYSLVLMSHPTFSGTFFQDKRHGIEPGILLGTFFRLAGTDISVFPNFGGRFTFSQQQCREIGERLRAPLGTLPPSWPAPAGGMKFDNIGGMARTYGADAVFMCGGALLSHSANLTDSTRLFLDKVRQHFGERLAAPQPRTDPLKAQEHRETAGYRHVPFEPSWNWLGRARVEYKGEKRIPFKDISRVELFGKSGEESGFEVRYFEIQPGGFSSREKHQHVHCIVAVRGLGQLTVDDRRYVLKPHDLAYVPPLAVHQLHNEGPEPFGFFCIVDRERDRPLDPGA